MNPRKYTKQKISKKSARYIDRGHVLNRGGEDSSKSKESFEKGKRLCTNDGANYKKKGPKVMRSFLAIRTNHQKQLYSRDTLNGQ